MQEKQSDTGESSNAARARTGGLIPLTVVETLFEGLAKQGLTHVFTVPGDDPYVQKAIHTYCTDIIVRRENAACFAAQAMARLCGVAVCAFAHGPGMTNSFTGIAAAKLEHDPVIVLCSQLPETVLRDTDHAYVPSASLEPFVKHIVEVVDPITSSWQAEDLINMTKSAPRGPVAVVLAHDVSRKPAFHRTGSSAPQVLPHSIVGPVEQAANLLHSAKRPVALIGAEVVQAGASEMISSFVQRFTVGAMTTYDAKGVLGGEGEVCVCPHLKNWETLPPDPDLWLVIGVDSTEGIPSFWQGKPSILFSETDSNLDATFSLIGPLCESVAAISTLANVSSRTMEWNSIIRSKRQPLHAIEVLAEGSQHFPGKITVDTGLFKHAWGLWGVAKQPLDMLFTNGLSVMGWSLGAAIGAVCSTGMPCLAVTGDGGFSASISELFAIRQYNLPVSLLVISDGHFGMIRWQQRKILGHDVGCVKLADINYQSIARSFDMNYLRISNNQPEKWPEQFEQAAQKPTLMEFEVNYKGFMEKWFS